MKSRREAAQGLWDSIKGVAGHQIRRVIPFGEPAGNRRKRPQSTISLSAPGAVARQPRGPGHIAHGHPGLQVGQAPDPGGADIALPCIIDAFAIELGHMVAFMGHAVNGGWVVLGRVGDRSKRMTQRAKGALPVDAQLVDQLARFGTERVGSLRRTMGQRNGPCRGSSWTSRRRGRTAERRARVWRAWRVGLGW
jgi:hypothetical protein